MEQANSICIGNGIGVLLEDAIGEAGIITGSTMCISSCSGASVTFHPLDKARLEAIKSFEAGARKDGSTQVSALFTSLVPRL
jgi:hypothetical protein